LLILSFFCFLSVFLVNYLLISGFFIAEPKEYIVILPDTQLIGYGKK